MYQIRLEAEKDIYAIEDLLDSAFGHGRFAKTAQRLRDGQLPVEALSFVADSNRGHIMGTIRMWNIVAGSAGPSLLLGPLAVDKKFQKRGIGSHLMSAAIDEAVRLGHRSILLVGDAPFYQRFGFSREMTYGLELPGPVDDDRFLGLELVKGSLKNASGCVSGPFPKQLAA